MNDCARFRLCSKLSIFEMESMHVRVVPFYIVQVCTKPASARYTGCPPKDRNLDLQVRTLVQSTEYRACPRMS